MKKLFLFLTASLSITLTSIQAVRAQTNTATGVQALQFNTGGFNNTATGYGALRFNTIGYNNTATGYNALYNNTTGFFNTATGYNALYNNTTGFYNTASGFEALHSNSAGFLNTATGYNALFSNTIGTYNTASGVFALNSNTTGNVNTAFGAQALRSNTTGQSNTASGVQALYSNTTGGSNTATGTQSLASNTTGSQNSATGVQALYVNTTGFDNTATGYNALQLNSTGFRNTATGVQALDFNTGGFNNTATGYGALRFNTNGYSNTANGYNALYNNTSGFYNTANGYNALYNNTSGFHNTASGFEALLFNTIGDINTATGYQALRANNTGAANTANGVAALQANTAGTGNTGIGFNSLYLNTTGVNNTASGGAALALNTTGSYNVAFGVGAGYSNNNFSSTFIGTFADAAVDVTNSTALGFEAVVNASNQVRIGNSAITSIGGFANWTNLSDGRFKKNIKEDVPGLSFITKLRPVTYTLDVDGIDSKLKANMPKREGVAAKAITTLPPSDEEQKAKAEKAKVKYTGFVAQEVEAVAKKLNYDFSGVDVPKNKNDYYGLRYAEFVVPLVKSVQELSIKNDGLETQIQTQQQQIEELKGLVTKLMNGQTPNVNNTTTNTIINLSGAYLEQNMPNPHRGSTIIRYHLPQSTINAKVVITNMKGQLVKSIDINSNGDGQLTLNAASLAVGTYTYSLWIDGKEVDAKKMILAR